MKCLFCPYAWITFVYNFNTTRCFINLIYFTLGSGSNQVRMLQKLCQKNLAHQRGQQEKKYYAIVQEGLLEGKEYLHIYYIISYLQNSNCHAIFLCSKLASLLGEGNSSQPATTSSLERMPSAAAPKKMTPKRRLRVG